MGSDKSTVFTEAEKQALGIVGLVPDATTLSYSVTEPALRSPVEEVATSWQTERVHH